MIQLRFILVLSLFCFAAICDSNAQKNFDKILSSADATTLGESFQDLVDLSFFDQDKTVKKSKAVSMLKNFFDAHPIKSYQRLHEGASRDRTSRFTIGRMTTRNREQFKIWLYYSSGAETLISEIRIVKI